MIPAVSDSLIYFSLASLSGQHKISSLLVGRGAPERRSMASMGARRQLGLY